MAQKPCCNFYFPFSANMLSASSRTYTLVPHAGGRFLNGVDRPFIPIAGLKLDGATNTYQLLTVASHQANGAVTLLEMARESRQASYNAAQDIPLLSNLIGDYSDYLFKKLFANPAMNNRFNNLYDKVYNFWINANPAWTPEQYYANFTALINKLITEADRTLYLSPGDYDYDLVSAFNVAFVAWQAADPLLAAIQGLEIYV